MVVENRLVNTEGDGGENARIKVVVNALREGKLVVVCALIASLAIAALYLYVAPPLYQADALIEVEDESSALGIYSELGEAAISDGSVGAEIEIIRSRSVLGEVVDRLGLQTEVLVKYPIPFGSALVRNVPSLAKKLELISTEGGLPQVDLRRFNLDPSGQFLSFYLHPDESGRVSLEKEGGGTACAVPIGSYDVCEVNAQQKIGINIRSITAEENVRFQVQYYPRPVAVQRLRAAISVFEVGRDTGVLKIVGQGRDKEKIKAVVEETASAYVQQNVERRSEQARKSLDFLTEQLPKVRDELEIAEERLARFRENNSTLDLSLETESILSQSVDLEKKISELELKRSELNRLYTSTHPLLKTLDEQKNQLISQQNRMESQTADLPDLQKKLLTLMREVEVSTQLYTFLLNKTQELRVVQAGTVGNVRVIDHAEASMVPVRPRKKFVLFVGGLIGSLIAFAFLYIKEITKVGISNTGAIEKSMGIPVYATLPYDVEAAKKKNKLVCALDSESVVSESFRSLRTGLHFAKQALNVSPTNGATTITISGPAPGVGKTFVCSNLAATLALTGEKVLFIDCDMRRGDADKLMAVARYPGVSHYLSGTHDFNAVTQRHQDIPTLHVISRSKCPPNPAELLMTDRFSDMLDEAKAVFKYIVIDTPPILAVTDASQIASKSDLLFLVARAGRTQMGELHECQKRFERSGQVINGVIVNGMTRSISRADGGYSSAYGYYNYTYRRTDESKAS